MYIQKLYFCGYEYTLEVYPENPRIDPFQITKKDKVYFCPIGEEPDAPAAWSWFPGEELSLNHNFNYNGNSYKINSVVIKNKQPFIEQIDTYKKFFKPKQEIILIGPAKDKYKILENNECPILL